MKKVYVPQFRGLCPDGIRLNVTTFFGWPALEYQANFAVVNECNVWDQVEVYTDRVGYLLALAEEECSIC